jgi:Uma2 family endonuclease
MPIAPESRAVSEEAYLALDGNRLVEYSDGVLEELPMPTEVHQAILLFLYTALSAFVTPRNLGKALVAPFRVRLWPGKFCEPDLLFMLKENAARRHNEFWEGADLVMEVVSDDDRRRDLDTKRREYAEAGISEYWIVDPREQKITVLRLNGGHFDMHGGFVARSQAVSLLLPGFGVDVAAVFEVARADR